MSTFKKTKVVMLPTNKKAPNHDYLFLYKPSNRLVKDGFVQHLYFLLDEPIKEGDWCIMLDSIGNVFSNPQQYTDPSTQYLNKGHRKIIATTDKSLTINSIYGVDRFDASIFSGSGKSEMIKLPQMFNLPQPSQSFIEKFVEEYNKGSVITEVMVEYEPIGAYSNPKYDSDYRLKVNSKDNTITIRKIKNSWSREEVEKLCREARYTTGVVEIDKWIEENL